MLLLGQFVFQSLQTLNNKPHNCTIFLLTEPHKISNYSPHEKCNRNKLTYMTEQAERIPNKNKNNNSTTATLMQRIYETRLKWILFGYESLMMGESWSCFLILHKGFVIKLPCSVSTWGIIFHVRAKKMQF